MTRQNVLTRAKKEQAFALVKARRLDEARQLYIQVCRIDRQDPEAWFMLGALQGMLGRYSEAADCLRRVIEIQPQNPEAHYNLATALKDMGRLEEAAAAYREALRCKPDYADAWDGLGFTCMSLGRLEEATAAYREVVRLRPKDAKARANYGSCLHAAGRLQDAVDAYRVALEQDPANADIFDKLGCALCEQGKYDEAIIHHRKALEIAPNDSIGHSNLLLTMHYHPGQNLDEIFVEHRRWTQRHAKIPTGAVHHANIRDPERRLRVGYVSSDFRSHSVAFFIEPLLANHDRSAVETVCYSGVTNPDATTERLRKMASQWRDIGGLSDEQVVNMIRADGIDILIDLAGHTAGNRLKVFASKPAPVQVTYLGYPDTTGLATMDYRLSDTLADPAGQDEYYTEKLLRLPNGFLCYQPLDDSPPVSRLPALENGYVTFGSFNNLSKINPDVIDLWVKLLQQIPGARLFVKNPAFTDTATRERYYGLFEQRGVTRDHVELQGRTATQAEHLALYARLDVALDTFPYNGTTTTCEALWMGVPVVTLAGRAHAGRVGLSLLTAVGLRELVAETPEEYIARAAALAANLDALSTLRASLRDRMRVSPLCDATSFTRGLEAAFREMWRRWCAAGQAPA